MQTQHLIIIGLGSILALLLLTYFIRRALIRALNRSFDAGLRTRDSQHDGQVEVLRRSIFDLSSRHFETTNQLADLRQQARLIRATPFVHSDHETLLAAAETLRLAVDTWKNWPATAPYRSRAIKQAQLLGDQADRVLAMVESNQHLNSQSLDTQLIEWLNERGDLFGDTEISNLRFPHIEACPTGYPHIRDALREAFEQNRAQQTESLAVEDQPELAA